MTHENSLLLDNIVTLAALAHAHLIVRAAIAHLEHRPQRFSESHSLMDHMKKAELYIADSRSMLQQELGRESETEVSTNT